jgi:hypothetical protein
VERFGINAQNARGVSLYVIIPLSSIHDVI